MLQTHVWLMRTLLPRPVIVGLAGIWLPVILLVWPEWQVNPQYGYGWFVPGLAAYLLLRGFAFAGQDGPGPYGVPPQAGQRPSPLRAPIVAALLFVVLRWVAGANPDWRLLYWIQASAAIMATLLFLRSEATLHRIPPGSFGFILFLLTMVPWPSGPETTVVQLLMRWVASAVVEVMNLGGIPAVQRGNVVDLPGFSLGVDEACSGIRTLQASLMAALFWGACRQPPTPVRIFLVIAAIVTTLGLNFLRAILLGWTALHLPGQYFPLLHDGAGIVGVIIAFLVLGSLTRRHSGHHPLTPDDRHVVHGLFQPVPHPLTRGHLVTLLSLIGIAEVLPAVYYHSNLQPPTLPLLVAFNPRLESSGTPIRPLSDSVRTVLRANDAYERRWPDPRAGKWTGFLISWKPGRLSSMMARAHQPETCLSSSGFVLSRLHDPINVEVVPGHPMFFDHLEFVSRTQPVHVFFTIWDGHVPAGGKAPPPSMSSWTARLEDVLHRRRHGGQQIIELALEGVGDSEAAIRSFQETLHSGLFSIRSSSNP